jgi:monovalent cation:H+ antiporter-2, CPA2 family
VHGYADALRRESCDTLSAEHAEYRALGQLLDSTRRLEISFARLEPESALAGQTLARLELRARTGASVVAVERDGALVPNPSSDWPLRPCDGLALLGDARQVTAAHRLLGRKDEASRD